MKKLLWRMVLTLVLSIVLLAGAGWYALDADLRRLVVNLPTNANVLFWPQPTRDAGFRVMDRLGFLAKSRDIPNGPKIRPLPEGRPLMLATDLVGYMNDQRTAGLVILHEGRIRVERYGLDFGPGGRWTSFSVAKSLTSTLVGAAIRDGHIRSLDDKVSTYVSGLKGSAYDDVTIEQLLTMTSGVRWSEDYADRDSDVAQFNRHRPEPGVDQTVSYMRRLPREATPGTRWLYNTGETNLIGVLISEATGKTVSAYLSEKLWAPFGMEQKATWILGSTGHEIGGCCVQAATRDYARVGQFMLEGGLIDGKPVLPDDWIARATTRQADIGEAGRGYGYQWWTYDDGSYAGQGIFGQGLFIDPKRQLVIATNGNWPQARDPQGLARQRLAFYRSVQATIDAETRVARYD